MKKRTFKITVIAILCILALVVFRTLYLAGSFKKIEPHFSGKMEKIYSEMPGPEDFQADPETRQLFISSADRRNPASNTTDGIYLLDLTEPAAQPVRLPTTLGHQLHPHGLSLLRQDTSLYVYVVNHNPAGHFIEIFRYMKDTLYHLKSISHPSLCCPNDVVAVDTMRFYVTNDHGHPSGFLRVLEDYLVLPFASIFYYDGSTLEEVFSGMRYANGIEVSGDGRFLFAAETTGRKMLTFSRDPDREEISLIHRLPLHTGVDNIDMDANGNLWIGAHPKLLDFVRHASDPASRSPSQVLKIIPRSDSYEDYEVQEIYLDNGDPLSGSSVAIQYDGMMLVGVVFDNTLMKARLNK